MSLSQSNIIWAQNEMADSLLGEKNKSLRYSFILKDIIRWEQTGMGGHQRLCLLVLDQRTPDQRQQDEGDGCGLQEEVTPTTPVSIQQKEIETVDSLLGCLVESVVVVGEKNMLAERTSTMDDPMTLCMRPWVR